MAMVRKDGKLPANARVNVDYTGKKPKIEFSYPKLPARVKKRGKKFSTVNEDAISQNTFGTHTYFLLFVFALGWIYFYAGMDYGDFPTNCTGEFEGANLSGVVVTTGADIYCDEGNFSIIYMREFGWLSAEQPGFYFHSTQGKWQQMWYPTKLLLVMFGSIIILWKVNKIITKILVKNVRYQKWLPEHNAKQRMKKYWRFTKKDFDPETSPFVEVPDFKNVSIEYKCTGDFSKQLKKIKIREHRSCKYDTKKKKVGKLKVEILKWTARFYFDKVPKDGHMEVIYY